MSLCIDEARSRLFKWETLPDFVIPFHLAFPSDGEPRRFLGSQEICVSIKGKGVEPLSVRLGPDMEVVENRLKEIYRAKLMSE